jgi:uncharacterized coiled-coil DUF342 family protein
MLNNAIKESKDPEVAKLKEEIDAVKKERGDAIAKVKDNRRRLNYKEAESVAITKLLDIEKAKDKDNSKRRKIGYLKRLKNKLEFKISTEAQSLTAEKELVRQIEEINKELSVAYKAIRLERKTELVKSDIEECRKNINDYETKIQGHDKRLDELYDKLRRLLGIERAKRAKPAQKKRVQSQQMPPEINLEDIAVIKKKDKKPVEDEDADGA